MSDEKLPERIFCSKSLEHENVSEQALTSNKILRNEHTMKRLTFCLIQQHSCQIRWIFHRCQRRSNGDILADF